MKYIQDEVYFSYTAQKKPDKIWFFYFLCELHVIRNCSNTQSRVRALIYLLGYSKVI